MSVSKMPAAGRAPRTPGNTRPPRTPGKLNGNTVLANAATVKPDHNQSAGTAPKPQGGTGS